MKRFVFAVVLALAAMLGACAGLVARAGDFVARVYQKGKRLVLGAVAHAATVPAKLERPAVSRIQACAYLLRIAKRERPVLTSGWRACPSV